MTARLLITLLLLGAAPVHAQDLESAVQQFDHGNRLFVDGDYRAAIDEYREALEAGYASGALYYNMGNAFFRLDEIGQAIRYYEKAGRLMPANPELAHNLAIARGRTTDSFSRIPEPFWRSLWNELVGRLSPSGLFLVGLLFYAAALGALGMRIRHRNSPWLRRTILLGGSLALSFIFLGFSAAYERAHATRAVVLSEEVRLLNRPGGSSADVLVHEGTVVDVISSRGAWSEVRLPNGMRGWMQSDVYGTI